jgi:hypothetical protein
MVEKGYIFCPAHPMCLITRRGIFNRRIVEKCLQCARELRVIKESGNQKSQQVIQAEVTHTDIIIRTEPEYLPAQKISTEGDDEGNDEAELAISSPVPEEGSAGDCQERDERKTG